MSAACKRFLVAVLLAGILCGCSQEKRFSVTWLDLFDTVCSFTAYCESREVFDAMAEEVHAELLSYHRLFDAYHEYEGVVNLCSLNARAALSPVRVEPPLYAILEDAVSLCRLSNGKLNAAMGAVLRLWHEASALGTELPALSALQSAALHCDIGALVLDNGCVSFSDADLKLDLGALAKGFSAQRIFDGFSGNWLLNLGGTVAAKGVKPHGESWQVAVSNAVTGGTLCTVALKDALCATSSDSQRYFIVDGIRYSHIIDPDTLYPPTLHRQVTVICGDGTLADALSTVLFLLPQEEGEKLAERCHAKAMWL